MSSTTSARTLPLLLGLVPAWALAQGAPTESVAAEPVAQAPLAPPVLTQFVPAVYPPEAEAAGLQADVVLVIDVDVTGRVTKVEVTAPAGHGFDEAAVTAAQQFKFTPGRSGDTPVPVRITYKYRFILKKEAQPAAVTLRGLIKERGTRALLAGIPVLHVEGGARAETGESGAFELALPPGEATVRIDIPEYFPFETREKIAEGKRTEVVYYLERRSYDPYETIVRGRRPKKEVSQTALEIQEVSRVPGTQGDTLKVVQNLPGVARAAFGGGEIIVWGSNPQDTGVYMDGVRIPRLYHFGGLRSVVHGGIVSDVNFVPGAYGARYGRGMGGIVEVGLRPPKDDRIHGDAAVDILDTSLMLEGPITDRTSFLLAGRRSYIDVVLKAVVPEDELQFRTAPRYYDYQGMLRHASTSSGTFTAMVIGSDDALAFLADDPDPNARFALDGHDLFHRGILFWKKQLGPEEHLVGSASVGYSRTTFSGTFARNARFEFEIENLDYTTRLEYERPLGRWLGLTLGADVEGRHSYVNVLSPGRGPREDEDVPEVGAPISDETRFDALATGPYVELPVRLMDDRLRIVPGLRLDFYIASAYRGTPDEIKRVDRQVEPRLRARYEFDDRWAVKAAGGLYYQPPAVDQGEVSRTYGNPDIKPQYDIQFAAGAEYSPRPKLHVEMVGFYKDFHRLIVASGDPMGPYLNNDGTGRAYGGELLLRHDPSGRFFGWVAYTLMRSERRDHPDEEPRLFDSDQTHILTVVASRRFGRNWEAGLRFRLTSGTPYTDVTGSYVDTQTGQFQPIYSDDENGARLPAFHSLDLRIEKTWVFQSWLLSGYLELLNAYNRENPELIVYNYDYTEHDFVSGLPILPVFGLRGQF